MTHMVSKLWMIEADTLMARSLTGSFDNRMCRKKSASGPNLRKN